MPVPTPSPTRRGAPWCWDRPRPTGWVPGSPWPSEGAQPRWGVFFDKAPTERRPGTAGWYNTAAFEAAAAAEGLTSASLNADAFSHETKARVIEVLKERFPPVDLVVNSVASPRRVHPDTGVAHTSVLKPIGQPYESRSVNTDSGEVVDVSLEPANDEDIANTVAVMGGEDWRMWMDALGEAGVLADGCRTVSYSYIGPEMTWPIYKDGTIGQAKADLHRTAAELNERLSATGGRRPHRRHEGGRHPIQRRDSRRAPLHLDPVQDHEGSG